MAVSKPGAPVDAGPIPVRVTSSRPDAPVPCRAGPACKRLLRRNAERSRLKALRISAEGEKYDEVSDVPLEEYYDDSSENVRRKLNTGVSGPRLPPHKKRRRALWLEEMEDVSDTPLEQCDDHVPENHACHTPSLGELTHGKATGKVPRPIDGPKVKGSTGQEGQLSKGQQRTLNREGKRRFPEPSVTVEPQSNGTKVCAVTTVRSNNKSSLALAAGKDVNEKKALKRLGTPCKNEDAKKVKSASGTVKRTAEPCVGASKKSSSQTTPTVKASPSKSVESPASDAKNNPKMHTAASDNQYATQEARGPKSIAGATTGKVGVANDGICRTPEDGSLSAAKRALPDKLTKKPEPSARGSLDKSARNLGVSAKCLPETTQKATNDRPQTKKAASVTGQHNAAGSSAAKNTLPKGLAQKPQLCAKGSSTSSHSNSTRLVPSSSKDAAQAKAGCIFATTLQSIDSSATKNLLPKIPKIPKKPMTSDMSANSDATTLKKAAVAKRPTSTPKFVKDTAEAKAGRSSGTDLPTVGPPAFKQAPSLNKTVNRQVSCAKSSDIPASKPPSPVSIPKKLLTFTSKADKSAVPSIPAKKSTPCVNGNSSKVLAPEKMAKVDKKIHSDLKTEHKKKCSDGHPRILAQERSADNAANHSSTTPSNNSSKLHEVTNGKQFKSTALSACATTVEVKISRSKLTSCPDTLSSPSKPVNSAESLTSEQSKQRLMKLPEGTPLLEQADCPVSHSELGTSLQKACNVDLPDGNLHASTVPETTVQAEATVPATSEGPHRTVKMPTEGTAGLEEQAQESEQPAENVVDSVPKTVLGSNGLIMHEKTGASQDVYTSKTHEPMTEVRDMVQDMCMSEMREPMTEVRELIADVIVQVVTNLADIGAEVECGDECVREDCATVRQGDQVRLAQDSSETIDGLATSAEHNAVGTSGPELLTNATEHAALEQKVQTASEAVNKRTMTVPCKLDDLESVCTVSLSPVQANGLSMEEEQYKVPVGSLMAMEMPPTTGDCETARSALPESRCLQDSAGKDPGATHNDRSPPTLDEHSHQEPQTPLSQPTTGDRDTTSNALPESCCLQDSAGKEDPRVAHNDSSTSTTDELSHLEPQSVSSQRPGTEATTVAKKIRDSESVAVREGISEEMMDVSKELVASDAATEAMKSSDAGMCTTTDQSNCQQEPDDDNGTLQEVHTDNAALSTAQKYTDGEVRDEKKDVANGCASADESSVQEAEALSAHVQDTEGKDTFEPTGVDDCLHNESRSLDSQVDEPTSLPKESQESSDTAPGSSNGLYDESTSTETSDALSLLSEDSVEDASRPAIPVARASKPSSHSKKKRNRSSGTNTSLCSAWVFSRNRRGKRKRRDKHHNKSVGEDLNGTHISASVSTEAAATNASTVSDVPAQEDIIRKLEAAPPQIKKEPLEVHACGDAPVRSDARKFPCASTVSATEAPEMASSEKPPTLFPAAPRVMLSSPVREAMLDIDLATGLNILDVCGSNMADLEDLKSRVFSYTITKNEAVAKIARSVHNAVVDEYFKGERAVKTLQLLSKIPFSLEPSRVDKIRELTQAVVGEVNSFTKVKL